MLEKEQQFVETKRVELARGYNPAGAVELANAEKRVKELQLKYNQMAHRLGLSTSESQPQVRCRPCPSLPRAWTMTHTNTPKPD